MGWSRRIGPGWFLTGLSLRPKPIMSNRTTSLCCFSRPPSTCHHKKLPFTITQLIKAVPTLFSHTQQIVTHGLITSLCLAFIIFLSYIITYTCTGIHIFRFLKKLVWSQSNTILNAFGKKKIKMIAQNIWRMYIKTRGSFFPISWFGEGK